MGGVQANLAPDSDDWVKLAKIAWCMSTLHPMIGSRKGSIEGGAGGASHFGLLELGQDSQAHRDSGLLAYGREAGASLG